MHRTGFVGFAPKVSSKNGCHPVYMLSGRPGGVCIMFLKRLVFVTEAQETTSPSEALVFFSQYPNCILKKSQGQQDADLLLPRRHTHDILTVKPQT